MNLLVLGLGNIICGDDGLGVAAVAELGRYFDPPPESRFADGGTLGLSLLPLLEDAEDVILVDAIRDGDSPPGTPVRLEGDEVAPAVLERLSVHQVGVADLLAGAAWHGRMPRIVLLGLVPETVELRLGLSASVAERLPELVARVVVEAGRLGHRVVRKAAQRHSGIALGL